MEGQSPPFFQNTKDKNPEKEVEIWFQDESRFGQQGILTKIWAKKNTRPVVDKQNGRASAYLFGAINPLSGDSYGLILPAVNTDAMNLFLSGLSKKMSRWKHCLLIVDGAGWHRSDDLKVPKNISLLQLPPYSPELNCIERLWGWMKDNYLALKTFDNIEAVFDAGCHAWQKASEEIIRSVCHTPWLPSTN
jgi:transposase